MRSSTALIVLAMAIGIAILVALGSWQVVRMNWKEGLIASIHVRSTSQPVTLGEIENRWQAEGDVDYVAVSLEGIFEHDREMYYFNTLNGQTGWNVITPLRLKDNRILLLNRGFVPTKFRPVSSRIEGQIKGTVKITGLARNPITQKPNRFIPDNQLLAREFFWKSQAQMISLTGEKTAPGVLPFMVDAGKSELPFRYPLGGTTRMQFPNSHLQYALTWYGLALSLLAVGSVFLYERRKQVA